MNLYLIDQDIGQALAMVDEDGLITEEGYQELMQLQHTREELIEGLLLDIKNSEATAEAIKAEERALADRRKALEKRATRSREYLQQYAAGEVIETPRASLKWRKSTSVVITNEEAIPREYIKVKTTETPDKTAIKDALKTGEVPGAHLETKENPQIK